MKRLMWIIVAGLALVCGQQADAALLMYLRVDGIDGPVTEKGFEKTISVDAFSLNVTITQQTSGSGGAAGGKTVFSPFQIKAKASKASPKLFESAVKGEHIDEVKLSIVDAAEKAKGTFAEWILGNVVISRFQTGATAGGDLPTEIVEFSFGTVEYVYQEFGKDGKLAGSVRGAWNIAENKPLAFISEGTVENFQFVTGTVIPEPTAAVWLAAAPWLLCRRARRVA